MITADQLVLHSVGDYVLQSDWMATTKTQKSVAALAHVITYTFPFLLLTRSWQALIFIAATHFLIDRWRLARFVVWAKNFFGPFYKYIKLNESSVWTVGDEIDQDGMHYAVVSTTPPLMRARWNPPWKDVAMSFGYPKSRPAWLAVWLMIIVDNIMHVVLNGIALKYLVG